MNHCVGNSAMLETGKGDMMIAHAVGRGHGNISRPMRPLASPPLPFGCGRLSQLQGQTRPTLQFAVPSARYNSNVSGW